MVAGRLRIAIVLAATVLTCWKYLPTCRAVEPAGQPPPKPSSLDFRRVYVPESRIGEVIRGEYVPYNSDKFETLIDELGRAPGEVPPAVLATQAVFQARFDEQGSLGGEAFIDLQLLSKQAATLSFDGCNLAISDPSWDEQPPRDARLGRTNAGHHVLFAEKSGRLMFDWSSRGATQANGDVVFSLSLPKCTSTQMVLQLPVGWSPSVPGAVIRETTLRDGVQSWSVLLNGSRPISLRLVRPAASERQDALVRNMDLTYSIDKTLVRLLAEVRLDVEHRPLRQLSFRVSAPLRIRAAHLGNTALEFVTSSRSSNDQIVTVQLPHLVQGIDRRLKLDAVMPPVLERDWRLPGVTVLNAQWQQARTSLELLSPIALQHLRLSDCVQTSVNPSRDPPRQTIEIQHVTPDATIAVWLGSQPRRSSYTGGTTIRLSDEELRATAVLDVTCAAGSQFNVDLGVPRPWIVDSVKAAMLSENEDSPTAVPEESNVPLDWSVSSREDAQRSLVVSLQNAIRAGRLVRFRIQAHRPRPELDATLSIEQLQVVTPREITRQRHLVALHGQSPYRFELQSDREISWFDPAQATSQERTLVSTDAGGLVFLRPHTSQALHAYVTQTAAHFNSSIEVRTRVQRDSLLEMFRIRCTPVHNASVDKIQVALSQTKEKEILWFLEGESMQAATARKLSVGEQRLAGIVTSDDQSSIDVWEITLTRPRNVPFTIVGRRSAAKNANSVALVWMPKASSQDGTLILESDDGTQFDVQQKELTPFPLASSPVADFSAVERAGYRYRPVDLPVIRIVRCRDEDTPVAAWAWACHLISRVSEAETVHSVTYRIENIGLSRIALKLPDNSELREVLLDGRAINVSLLNSVRGGRISLTLPTDARHPTVDVTFTDGQRFPVFAADFHLRLPEINIPVLHQHATLWVPPDIGCSGSGRSLENDPPEDRVATRLLGPLVRSTTRGPWDTSELRRWWTDVIGAGDTREKSLQILQAFSAAQLGASTWSQLITQYAGLRQLEDGPPLPELFVDRLSLQRSQITPSSPLPASAEAGIEGILDRAGLAILLEDDRIVLVSQLLLATRRREISTINATPVCELRDRSKQLAQFTTMSGVQWLDFAAHQASPWKSPDYASASQLFHAGWTAREFEMESSQGLTIKLVRSNRMQLFAWGVFFLFTGVGWWVSALRPRRLFAPLVLSASAAILVPFYISLLATACFLGLVLGTAIGLVAGRTVLSRSARAPVAVGSDASSRAAIVTAVVGFLAIGAAVSAVADDSSEQPSQPPPKKTPKIHAVVIPVDKDKRPTGDVVYLPRDFFEALLGLTANRNESSPSWLMRVAEYDLTLAWKGVSSELAPADLTATYLFDVVGSKTEVILPLSREHLKVMSDRAVLNGKSVQVDWAADGNGLIFDAGRAGSHMLELSLLPMTRAEGDLQGLGLAIPSVPNSLLRVHLPAGAAAVDIPESLGAVDRSHDRLVTAQLGPARRMDIRWPPGGMRGDRDARVAVSELFWLRVNQGSVVMRSKFHFSTTDGSLDPVAVRYDPRLQLRLEPSQPIEVVREASTDAGATRTVHFRPVQRDATEMTVAATFTVSDTSGVGNLPMPRVEAVSDQTVRRWLALSVASGLQVVGTATRTAEPMGTHAFLEQWNDTGGDQLAPDATYRLQDPRRCQFRIHPRPVDVLAKEILRIGVGNESASLQYRADIQVATGDIFDIRVQVPKDLELADVTLSTAGQLRFVDWVRTSAEVVTVLADGPLSQRATLVLHGKTRISRHDPFALPNLTIQSFPVASKRVELYRQTPVRLKLVEKSLQLRGWQTVMSEEQGSLDPELGRLVAVLAPVSDQQPGSVGLPIVSIRANAPRPSYQLATVARRVDGQWWAEISCRLYGFEGLVDTLQLDIPASWTQPFEAEGATVKRIDPPGSNRSRLLVHWPQALVDSSVVRLWGKLGGQPRELPDVHVADQLAERTGRFVALEVKSAEQKTDWQTTGLRETTWPPALFREVRLPEGRYRFFRVVGQRFRAWVSNTGPVAGIPRVRLADVRLTFGATHYVGIAAFDLEPAGLEQCVLSVPEQIRLLHVNVAGRPAMTSALEDQRWDVHLSHNQLPQRIELLYTGPWPAGGAKPLLHLPQIAGIPAERTLISVTGDRDAAVWQPDGPEVDSFNQELTRLRSMTTLIDEARTIAKDQIPIDKQRWFVPWARQLVASTRKVAGYRGNALADDAALHRQLSEISEIQLEAAEDLRTIGAYHEQLNAAIPRPGLSDAASAATFSDAITQRMIVNGPVPELELSTPTSKLAVAWRRTLPFVLLLCVSAMIFLLATRPPLKEWFVHWPFVFGAMAGLFWWLYLQPSVVGGLVVIVCVIAGLRGHGNRVRP